MEIIGFLALLLIVSFLWHFIWRKRQETARHIYFNRLAMPVLLLPDSPFDDGFPARIDAFKRALEESGNTFRPRIIAEPYYAPIGEMQTVNLLFAQYVQLQIEEYRKACEEVAATAYKSTPEVAYQIIAGVKNVKTVTP